MEEMSLIEQILVIGVPLVTGGIVIAVKYLGNKLNKLVAGTENTWDDKALAAFKDGLREGLLATPSEAKPVEPGPVEAPKSE